MLTLNGHQIEIQGHRGFLERFLENSLDGFMAAIELNIDCVEMDLLLTQDEEIIIHHDFFLNPKIYTQEDGSILYDISLIKDLKLKEVKKLRYKESKTLCIPTLKELFNYIQNSNLPHAKKIRLNFEIKADPANIEYIPSYYLVSQKILDLVKEYKITNPVYYSCFDPNMLKEVRKIDKNCTLGIILDLESLKALEIDPDIWVEKIIPIAKELSAQIISPHHSLLSPRSTQLLKMERLAVIPWTVNDENLAKDLLFFGVDGLISDLPKHLQTKLLLNKNFN